MVTDQFTPPLPLPLPTPPRVDKTTKHFAFHREGVDTFASVLAVAKEGGAVLHTHNTPKREELAADWSRPLISLPAW